jgi:nucleotide-binding universal stress UspA family protein
VLTGSIAAAAGSGGPVPVTPVVTEGSPARVPLDAAAGADLLMAASRGHGGLAAALPGSVSQHCVHHASCPVVVIRGAAEPG